MRGVPRLGSAHARGAAALTSVLSPFRRPPWGAAPAQAAVWAAAATAPYLQTRRFAARRKLIRPGPKTGVVPESPAIDRRVVSRFRGKDEDCPPSSAEGLIRAPLPTLVPDTEFFAKADTTTETEDSLDWHSLSRRDKQTLYTEAFKKSVDPIYFKPKLIKPQHYVHVGTLTAWGYNTKHLELWLDFAQRAAVALNMPCSDIERLPDRFKRWSLLKATTCHKPKDTWEWRRFFCQIKIFDTHPDVIDRWVYYVGTNVENKLFWNFDRITYDELAVGKRMHDQALLEVTKRGKHRRGRVILT